MKLQEFLEKTGGNPILQRLIEALQLMSPEDRRKYLDALQVSDPTGTAEVHRFLTEFFEGETEHERTDD